MAFEQETLNVQNAEAALAKAQEQLDQVQERVDHRLEQLRDLEIQLEEASALHKKLMAEGEEDSPSPVTKRKKQPEDQVWDALRDEVGTTLQRDPKLAGLKLEAGTMEAIFSLVGGAIGKVQDRYQSIRSEA